LGRGWDEGKGLNAADVSETKLGLEEIAAMLSTEGDDIKMQEASRSKQQ
jgi:hypothetical protein